MQQGGTEVLVQELLRGLAADFEIVLVSGDRDLSGLPSEFAGKVHAHHHWPAATAREAGALAQALATGGVQLAHFHFGGTYEWRSRRFWQCPIHHLARLGVPCVSTNHLAVEWGNFGFNPARPAWQKPLFQTAAWLSRAVVFRDLRFEVMVSEHDRARVARHFPMFRGKLLQRYHSLLNADEPPPELVDREPVILCVGTLGGRKAQPVLGEAFSRIAGRHPHWRLRFIGRVGDADYARQIEASAAAHGVADRVEILGRLSDEETLAQMKRGSIMALPSLQEGLGLSMQEALFHGCVGLGSRTGGIPELIDDEVNGLLVPPGDVPALSAALDRLLSDPGLLARMRIQSRPSIVRKRMTSAAMLENYRALYAPFLAA